MSVLWSDIQAQVQDYVRSPNTGGALGQGNLDRAINRAIEYFQRRLSLPSDKRIYRFYYTQSTPFYNLPAGFNESLGVYYDTQQYNIPSNAWKFRPDIDMLGFQGLGSVSSFASPSMNSRFWGFTTINQSLQLMMLGSNLYQPEIIDPLTSVGSWTASGDASALAQDTNIFQSGPASLKFTVTPSSGTATLSNTPAGNNYNFLTYVQNNGLFQVYVYMGSANYTSVQIQFGSSAGNYWTGSCTAQLSGTAFAANQWNLLGQYFNNFTMTGSPNSLAINSLKIIFNEGAGFSTTTTMHVQSFFVTVPDYMDLVYNSSYKGYVANSSPKTDILVFNYPIGTANNSDILYFGDYAPDLIDPIAKKAAVGLYPQLRQDKDFMGEYKQEVEELVKIFGRIYPRTRKMNFGRTHLDRTSLS
jgi:hypothetical protein